MAGENLLASILSGQDPLAAQMVPAYQAAQRGQAAINQDYGHNEGPFGALAKTLMGVEGSNLQPAVQNVVNQRVANQPNLAQLLASSDPYQALAAHPGNYSPLSAGTLLAGASPESVADARLKAAQGQYFGAKANYAATGGNAPVNPVYNSGIAPSASGHAATAAASPAPAGSAPILLEAAGKMSPQQRQAMMQNPQLRARYLAALRAAQTGAQ
jgi:hypothetical protein